MKSERKSDRDIIVGAGIALAMLLPAFYHCYWFPADVVPFFAGGLIMACVMAGAVLCVPWRAGRWLLFSLLFVGALFELAHLMVYDGDLSSAGYIRSLFMTTPYEAGGALGRVLRQNAWSVLLFACVYLVVSVGIGRVTPSHRFPRWLLGVSIVLMAAYSWMDTQWVMHTPVHTYAQMAEALRQRNERNALTSQPDTASWQASRLSSAAQQEVYMLIIDESLRYDHVSLDGAQYRITMPRMGQLDGLVSFSDYYTTGVFTMYAVPMIVTRATPADFSCNYTERGIQTVFAEAGFKTVWLTNEAQLVSDGVSHYVARGAEIIRVKRDMDIPAAMDSLCATADKLFVIVHLWGNHQFYINTDESTSRYLPDVVTSHAVRGEQMYVNAYDNSILYTDSMLLALTDVLRERHCAAQWLFLSDHGEGPIGDHGGAHGYTLPDSGEYHVPLMVWHSDAYAAAYPEKVTNMLRHKDAPICADHVFWSLIDMADIQVDSTLVQEGLSFFGDSLAPHPRTLLLPDGKSVTTLDDK